MMAPSASSSTSGNGRAVYVVANFTDGGNDRVRKLLRLRTDFDRVVLVSPGPENLDDAERLMRKRLPNPTGLLRILGLRKLKLLLDRYLFFPSVTQLFTRRVRGALARRIREDLAAGRKVTLLTIAPPHGLGVLGLYLKRQFPALRWVIDWQDLWSYDENYFLRSPPLYRNRVLSLEQRMLKTADLNLATNARARDLLITRYGVPADRAAFLHHHFDRSDFDGLDSEPKPASVSERGKSTVRVGFMGTLFKPPRVPGMEVVKVIEELREDNVDVELHVHGSVPTAVQRSLADVEGVFLHGRMSHEESVRQLSQYDYLLLFLWDLENSRVVMSIKLPHYMIVGVPILAVVPSRSAVADIVETTGSGTVVAVDEDWRSALGEILRAARAHEALERRNAEAIESFSWEALAPQWRAVLSGQDAVLSKTPLTQPDVVRTNGDSTSVRVA